MIVTIQSFPRKAVTMLKRINRIIFEFNIPRVFFFFSKVFLNKAKRGREEHAETPQRMKQDEEKKLKYPV